MRLFTFLGWALRPAPFLDTRHQPLSSRFRLNRRWLAAAAVGGTAVLALVGGAFGPHMSDEQEIVTLSHLADSGDTGAQLELGLAYRDGLHGLTPDPVAGAYWLKAAARGGEPYAADALGDAYETGRGVTKDPNRAERWWRAAAERGNAAAAWHLGQLLIQRGQNTEGRVWIERAKAAGYGAVTQRGEGQGLAGFADHLASRGLQAISAITRLLRGPVPDDSASALLAAARSGDTVAQYQLAMRYRDGGWGVEKDPALSFRWLQRAANGGNPVAMRSLAKVYQSGMPGVAPDPALATLWRTKAEQQALTKSN